MSRGFATSIKIWPPPPRLYNFRRLCCSQEPNRGMSFFREPATMNRRGEEGQRHSRINSSPKSSSRPKTPTSNTPRGPTLKLPQISQFSIACYAGFIGLAALYVAHSSANTSADLGILANKIATAALSQAQVANQIQLLQLCLSNSVSTAPGRAMMPLTVQSSRPGSNQAVVDLTHRTM